MHFSFFSIFIICAVLLVSILSTTVSESYLASAQAPLYVLDLFAAQKGLNDPAGVTSDGLKAALEARPTGAGGRPITLVTPTDPNAPVSTIIEQALADYPDLLAMVGPRSDELLEEIVAYTQANEPSLTVIGPYTFNPESRGWNMQQYYVRSSPHEEIYAIVTHLVKVLHVRRVGLMYVSGSTFSEQGYKAILSALNSVHMIQPIEFVQPSTDKQVKSALFTEFVERRPQAIIVYARSLDITYAFVQECASNSLTAGIPLFFGASGYKVMYLTSLAQSRYNFNFAATNVFPTNTEYKHIQVFEQEMKAFIATGQSIFPSYAHIAGSVMGGLTVYGWLVGRVLIQALSAPEAVTDRNAFQKWLFNQRQYSIEEDVLIGPFGGVCSPYEEMERAMCECNEGGHSVNIFSMTQTDTAPVLRSTYTSSRQVCAGDLEVIPFHAVLGVILNPDNPQHHSIAMNTLNSTLHALKNQDKSETLIMPTEVKVHSVEDIIAYRRDYLLDVALGPVMNIRNLSKELNSTLIIDPIDSHPVPRIVSPLVMYMMPTLDQQLYVTAQMVKEKGLDYAVILRRSEEFDAITNVVNNAAQFFSIPISIFDAADKSSMYEMLKAEFVTVIGLSPTSVATMRTVLEASDTIVVQLLYEEFVLFYDQILEAFADAPMSLLRRLITQTNLPLWTDFSAESEEKYSILKAYHQVFRTPNVTRPCALQMWYTAGVLKRMLNSRNGNEVDTVEAAAYHLVGYTVDTIQFRRYTWEDGCTADNLNCQNFGATSISMVSLARILDPSNEPALYGPVTPVVATTKAMSINLNLILAIAIPLVAVLTVICGIFLYLCCWKNSRDNANAPKDCNKPVTLMFTDIQSSTSLWATFPEEMAAAMDVHHRIIRDEITRFGCYEVKTIGDSFMVASENASTMVELAMAIQKALLSYDWGTFCFDTFYLQCEMDAKEVAEGNPEGPSSPQLVADMQASEEYRSKWNGLRVRMGMHTGLCDIRVDETTKGYDYYGDTVNTAARTESVASGGQVLMTNSSWDVACDMADGDRVSKWCVKDVGAHSLRGVPHPVQMYQLECVEGRVFKAINTGDGQDMFSDEDEDFDARSGTTAGSLGAKNQVADLMFRVLSGCLSTMPIKKKIEAVQDLLRQWRVSTRYVPTATPEEKYKGLLSRFVNRTYKIIIQRENLATDFGSMALGLQQTGTSGRATPGEFSGTPKGLGIFQPNGRFTSFLDGSSQRQSFATLFAADEGGGLPARSSNGHYFNPLRSSNGARLSPSTRGSQVRPSDISSGGADARAENLSVSSSEDRHSSRLAHFGSGRADQTQAGATTGAGGGGGGRRSLYPGAGTGVTGENAIFSSPKANSRNSAAISFSDAAVMPFSSTGQQQRQGNNNGAAAAPALNSHLTAVTSTASMEEEDKAQMAAFKGFERGPAMRSSNALRLHGSLFGSGSGGGGGSRGGSRPNSVEGTPLVQQSPFLMDGSGGLEKGSPVLQGGVECIRVKAAPSLERLVAKAPSRADPAGHVGKEQLVLYGSPLEITSPSSKRSTAFSDHMGGGGCSGETVTGTPLSEARGDGGGEEEGRRISSRGAAGLAKTRAGGAAAPTATIAVPSFHAREVPPPSSSEEKENPFLMRGPMHVLSIVEDDGKSGQKGGELKTESDYSTTCPYRNSCNSGNNEGEETAMTTSTTTMNDASNNNADDFSSDPHSSMDQQGKDNKLNGEDSKWKGGEPSSSMFSSAGPGFASTTYGPER